MIHALRSFSVDKIYNNASILKTELQAGTIIDTLLKSYIETTLAMAYQMHAQEKEASYRIIMSMSLKSMPEEKVYGQKCILPYYWQRMKYVV